MKINLLKCKPDDNSRYIDLHTWYHCLIDGKEELLKINRHKIHDDNTGVDVFCYRVDCYYYGKELFTGSLSECRNWIYIRLTMYELNRIRKEHSRYGKE